MDQLEIEEDAFMEALLESGLNIDHIQVLDLTEASDGDANPVTAEPTTVAEINSIRNSAPERPVLMNLCGDLVQPTSPTEEMVTSIIEEGFDRQDVERALKASFYNRTLARNYLVTSIPPYLGWTTSISAIDSSTQSSSAVSDVRVPSTRTQRKSSTKSNVSKGGKFLTEKIFIPNVFAELTTKEKKKIEDESGCKVKVQSHGKTDEAKPYVLRGNNDQVNRAKQNIWKTVSSSTIQVQPRPLPSEPSVAGPSTSRNSKRLSPPTENRPKEMADSSPYKTAPIPVLNFSDIRSSTTSEEPVLNVLAVNLEGFKLITHTMQLRDLKERTNCDCIVISEGHFGELDRPDVVRVEEVRNTFAKMKFYPVPCGCKLKNRYAGYHGQAIFSKYESVPEPKPILLLPDGEIDHRQVGITFKTRTGENVNLLGVHYQSGQNAVYKKIRQVFASKEWFMEKKKRDIDICIGDLNCHPTWKIRGQMEHLFKECEMAMESKIQVWDKLGGIDCWTHVKGRMLDGAFVRTSEGYRTEVRLLKKPDFAIDSDHPRILQVLIYKDGAAGTTTRQNLDDVCIMCKHCGRPYKKSIHWSHRECPFRSIHALLERSKKSKHNSLKRKQGIKLKRKIYQCNTCGKNFSYRGDLKRHQRTHTGEKNFSCSSCEKKFSENGNLKQHQLTHTGEKKFCCTVCGKSFGLRSTLRRHQVIHTGEKNFSCSFCGKSFSERGNLKSHQLKHTGERKFSCDVCGKSFKHHTHLKSHQAIHTEETKFCFDVCGKSFTQSGTLKNHQATHTGEKKFSCDVCGKSFNQRSNFKTHQLTHTGEKKFSCVVCGKSFTQSGNLNKHQLTHTGEKKFSCIVCGKSFNQRSDLKKHQLTHTGEKKFCCDVCGKSFTQSGTLKNHQATHSGEKKFSCDVCGKSFSLRGNLNLHQATHTGEKKFSCDVCGKSFNQRSNLKTHQLTHTGEKKFICDVCGKRFTRHEHLKRHRLTHSGK